MTGLIAIVDSALAPVQQDYLLEARQMQALSFIALGFLAALPPDLTEAGPPHSGSTSP
jgi:hypothetical protein